ncbi:MAG TPA: bacillithiol biosynthesis cysteine-adding enzyme BshC [Bacteroidia bacterium]|nr:bacillithiol biosynthesis cysteine-adding enzyme BshC [Bacteroidia bacterium]
MDTVTEIPFSSLPGFPRLFLDYVAGTPELETLYDFRPDQKGYEYAIRKVQAGNYNRALLASVLKQQYERTPDIFPAALADRLAQPGSCTVTTGHQLCLVGGPSYFVYKIASVIKLAEKLSQMYGANVVPVYWMASEDHDIDEIRSVTMFGKKITWNTPQHGAVGRLTTDDLSMFIEEVTGVLGSSPKALEMSAVLKKIYAPGKTLAQATREFVHWLFGDKIIVLDPDHAELKRMMTAIFTEELRDSTSEKLVLETNAFLSSKGYATQVNPRKINLFHLDGTSRQRIEHGTDGLHVVNDGSMFSKGHDFLEELKNAPENFSPNVVLRPVYQQLILPNVAYVGGPGEIVYWLQYKKMFDHYRVSLPVLQPRFFGMQISSKDVEWMNKNRVTVTELMSDFDEALKKKLADRAGEELSLENEKEVIELLRSTIADKASRADATLRAFAEAEMKKAGDALKVVEVRMIRAIKQREEVFTSQFRKLRDKLLPENVLQERVENFCSLSIANGIDVNALLSSELFPVNGVRILTVQPG